MTYTETEQREIDGILDQVRELTFDLDVPFPQLRQQNLPEVMDILHLAVEKFPNSAALHAERSLTYLRLGDDSFARISFIAAQELYSPAAPADFEFHRCRIERVTTTRVIDLRNQIARAFRVEGLSNEQKIALNKMNAELDYGPRY
ncbi:MAG: hypothetical protein AAF204_04290 [Pseudomonadota bacterium]